MKKKAGKNNLAVAYCRISTNEKKQSISLDMQEDRIRRYCELAGLNLVYIVREEVSASTHLSLRPKAMDMLYMLKQEGASHIVALKLDRLFRSTVDCLNQTEAWDKSGIALHLVDMGGQAMDTSSAIGRLFLTITAGFAEMERVTISERTSAALQHKKGKKEAFSATPYGWDRVGDRLVVNKQEQKQIGSMVVLRQSGSSYRAIASMLNAQRVPTKNGKEWFGSTVRRIILDEDMHAYSNIGWGDKETAEV